MYIPYYNALKTLLEESSNSIKTIDWYNQQYERYQDLKALASPACYIEFESTIAWQDASNKTQLADTNITIHLVHFDITDHLETIMGHAQDIHLAIHGKSLLLEGQQLSTSLARSESEIITQYDQIKVMKLTYHTALIDCSVNPKYSKRKAGLRVR